MGSGASQANYYMFEKYKDYDEPRFLNQYIEFCALKKRSIHGVFKHSDVFFFTQKECLIVCFHKGKSRVALIRQTKAYCISLDIYEEEKMIPLRQKTTIREALASVLKIAKSEYSLISNNCNDNALELIKMVC